MGKYKVPHFDAVGAFADILCSDTRKLFVTHGKRDRQLSVLTLLGAHPEVDEILPVERCQQERGRYAKLSKDMIGFALGIKVWHLVLTHEGWHAIVAERDPLACVFEGGPDDMIHAGMLRCLCHGARLRKLLLRRQSHANPHG